MEMYNSNDMNKPNSVEDFFRSRAEALEETPSRAAWKRLERRLDNHQRRNRIGFIRTFGMVAAILLLVVFAFMFSMVDLGQESKVKADMASAKVEPIATNVDPEAYKVVEYTIKYRDRMRNIIDEGAEDTKLQVRLPN